MAPINLVTPVSPFWTAIYELLAKLLVLVVFNVVMTMKNISLCRLRLTKLSTVFHLLDGGLNFIPPNFDIYHLKYLVLRLNILQQEYLYQSITKFCSLQTLVLHNKSWNSFPLSSEIWEMTQLRHLIISRIRLPPVP